MLTAAEAQSQVKTSLTVLKEVHAIEQAIVTAADVDTLEATVSDDTTMTDSTPEIVISATTAGPAVTVAHELIIDLVTVTFSGTTLNSVMNDINDANITGIVASKSANKLVITKTGFSVAIAGGTGNALVNLGLTAGTTAATPASLTYYTVWQAVSTNTAFTSQMDAVIKHFTDLSYTILRQKNSATNNTTFKWYVTW